ncbi:MAG: prepilin-type N-terminal cleavage/methylation domain-containing protein [Veillonella sp.]
MVNGLLTTAYITIVFGKISRSREKGGFTLVELMVVM